MSTIIATVTKGSGRRNDSAVFDVTLPDGQPAGIWAGKQTDMAAFLEIHQGDTVELTPGNKPGKYFFKRRVSVGHVQAPATNGIGQPAPAGGLNYRLTREEIGEYIETKAGQYFYAYKCVAEQFKKGSIEASEETLRQAAATVITSLDRNL